MKKIIISIGVLVLLGFAYYAISPLFRTVMVDDELPEGIIIIEEETAMSNESDVPSGVDNLTEEEKEERTRAMEEANKEEPEEMNEEMPESGSNSDANTTFAVMHTAGHPAEGEVRVIPTTEGTILRFEDYKTINGPNLHVYLAKDLKANDFVDLGKIRGTEGNINYNVPDGVDVSEYQYVMVWCVPFGVLFNYAEIN